MSKQAASVASSSTALPAFLQTQPSPVDVPSIPRLQALYASTSSQRISNATGYAANSTWWARVLQETLRLGWINGEEGDRLVLKLDEASVERLEWDGRRPKGLAGVVESQASTSPPTLHPLPHFLSSPTPLHAPASLARRFVGRPLYWALSQLNPFGSSEREAKEEDLWKAYGRGREYVHMTLLESGAEQFVRHMEENPILAHTDALHDYDSFRKAFGRVCLPRTQTAGARDKRKARAEEDDQEGDAEESGQQGSLSKRDIEVLVKWLQRDLGVVVANTDMIKILSPGETALDNPITEVDENTLTVLNTLKRAEAQIISLEKQISMCQSKAKAHLSSGQRNLAMSQLKSKKALEEILLRRTGVVDQLREVMRNIDEAQNDVEIMKAYQTSTNTLRTLLSNPLLDRAAVDQTTDDLAETLASQREVDEAIRIGGAVAVGAGGGEVDEGELEAELEALVKEEKERRERELEEAAARDNKLEEKRREQATHAAQEEPRKEEQQEVARPTVVDSSQSRTMPKQAAEPGPPASDAVSEAEWTVRYTDARQRETEERQRAAAERLAKEAKWALAE